MLNTKYREILQTEQKVREIITRGAEHGVNFDHKKAEELIPELDALLSSIEAKVEPHLPERWIPKSRLKYPPKVKFKKDGTPSANAEKYFGDLLFESQGQWLIRGDAGPVSLKDWDEPLLTKEKMTLSNQQDIKQHLMQKYKWSPMYWNTKKDDNGRPKKTSPKFHEQGQICPNLVELAEQFPFIEDIVLWLSYRNRRNVIRSEKGTGWLNHPMQKQCHRLPADADTIGAATFRFTHKTVVNVPRIGSVFGEQMRSLFKADEGEVLVGWDAASLEDRMKAHYVYSLEGGREYAKKILDPNFDVHAENMQAWGLPRPKCKNGHYAMQYNCRPKKLAETLGVPQEDTDMYYDTWWDNNKPLKELNKRLKIQWEQNSKKYLRAIDGRLVPVDAEYMLSSRLFQSAGIIVMKYAMVIWDHWITSRGIPTVQVIHNHDEGQATCPREYAELVGELGVKSITKAGEYLGFNVALLGEYSIGTTWADTH